MSIAPVINHKIIDLSNDNNYVFSIAPQGDGRSRYIDVSITDDGESYIIPSTAIATIDGTNAGKYEIHNSCMIDTTNNLIRVPLHLGILSFAGLGKYALTLYDGGSSIVSFSFNIFVTEAPYDIIRLEASDSYEALSDMVNYAKDSNKWIVGTEDPPVINENTRNNEYYLCSTNGNIYHCIINVYEEKQWVYVDNIKVKTYIKYSHNSDGSDMTDYPVSENNPSLYLGIYTGLLNEAPTDPSLYNWSMIRNGITNIVQSTIGGVGSRKKQGITVNYDNGTSSPEFVFYNGDTGDPAGFGTPTYNISESDSFPEVTVTADPLSPDTEKIFDFDFKIRGSKWFFGSEITHISGSDTTSTMTSATNIVGDMYLNSNNGCIYKCIAVTETNSTWSFVINLKSSATGFLDIYTYAQNSISLGYTGSVNSSVELVDSIRVSGTLDAGDTQITLTSTNSMFEESGNYYFKFYTSIENVMPVEVLSKTIEDSFMSITLKFVSQSEDMNVVVEILKR